MAQQKLANSPQSNHKAKGITRITVGGFKSIVQEQSIEIRPLTILAGANSSGKSSMMQPLLLMKQTLEAPYDPGALLLNGPNVRFTLADQLLSREGNGKAKTEFCAGFEIDHASFVKTYFVPAKTRGFDVKQTSYPIAGKEYTISTTMSSEIVDSIIIDMLKEAANSIGSNVTYDQSATTHYSIKRERFWLEILLQVDLPFLNEVLRESSLDVIKEHIREVIHLPGLRGNPERTYPLTAVGSAFSGTFQNYVASILGQWQADGKNDKLTNVNRDLKRLGLTGRVSAKSINDTQVELRVNRLLRDDNDDAQNMVNIADVGLGVSQTLPVVVALHAAQLGQLIYLEQPEIHLHPRAQFAMAEVLADAAMQGTRLIVETHSSLLLLGIQTLVAEGKLPPELVKLHWFAQQEDGSTQITSADLDKTGSFGEWPEDFDDVELYSEKRYLDAAQARLRGKK